MARKGYGEFHGLDTRRISALSDQKSARVAKNLYLTNGRVWKTRPGTELVASLPEETKGLYAGQGVLRTVAPAGYEAIYNRQRPNLFFDFVGNGTAFPSDAIQEFISAERFGASVAAGIEPYVVIRRNGRLEHHYITERPATPGGTVNTLVDLPFQPTGQAIKLSDKVWSASQTAGTVRFSSTQFGPSDWLTEQDAGFLPVVGYAPGDNEVTALGFMESTAAAVGRRQASLVVFFRDAVQIWAVDPDPLNHFLTGTLDGVGTDNAKSVRNVFGAPVFLDRGSFASLRSSVRSGALDTAKVGAAIETLTEGLGEDAVSASIWWEALGLYLCAVGSTIYVWQYTPSEETSSWSTWELPFTVTDFTILAGELYARSSDHKVYRFDADLAADDGQAFTFDLETQFLHFDKPGHYKMFRHALLYQQGTSSLSYRPDPTDPSLEVGVFPSTGVTAPHQVLPIVGMGDSVAMRFTGSGPWELSGFTIEHDMTGA